MNFFGLAIGALLLIFNFSIPYARAWGTLGHELIAIHGNALVPPSYFESCHLKPQQIIDHAGDADMKWKHDRRQHPDEELAHFFHIDSQPQDWKTRQQAEDLSRGFLVYRIVKWVQDAKALRKAQKWAELNERLYGLVHYVGDLSMPLHLTKFHDGKEVGLAGLHKQWESTMIMRYYEEIDKMVLKKLKWEKIPTLWDSIEYAPLIFNIAEQSHSKSSRLFESSRDSMVLPVTGRHGRRRHKVPVARFVKSKLFEATGELAATQLALSARLWAHTLAQICR